MELLFNSLLEIVLDVSKGNSGGQLKTDQTATNGEGLKVVGSSEGGVCRFDANVVGS